eukprot:TRINITY_DN8640_c0_g4_i1.p1 TRINITY_DN8640_c0_g4~~TRINITY_DN8640_c0_g4_i1.p1  ORF type:complete len:2147 (-),score=234.93 TRINITY_DN8640_c0_g4_i1:84-6143(-)
MGAVVEDITCTLPAAHEGYDLESCGSGQLSRCVPRCASTHVGRAQASCLEQGDTIALSGCVAKCIAPAIPMAREPSCAEGNLIPLGGSCKTSCLPGYVPSRVKLTCPEGGGRLDPPTFTCRPQDCAAPVCISNAASPPCSAGWVVPHGSACMPECKLGFRSTLSHLVCNAGVLTPKQFECEQVGIHCTVPVVEGTLSSSPCVEGAVIADGFICTPLCIVEHTLPTVPSLKCASGVLDPPFFECAHARYTPPAVSNAVSPPCAGGLLRVPHGQVCELQCVSGFRAQPPRLTCDRGKFLEGTDYTCILDAQACDAPTSVFHLNVGLLNATDNENPGFSFCQQGKQVPHGRQCTPVCALPVFSAQPKKLTCSDGKFFPEAFQCGRDCDVVGALGYISNVIQPVCAEGSSISHGTLCTPRCKDEFKATHDSLSCYDGEFTPSNFVCEEIRYGCDAPAGVEMALEPVACAEGAFIPTGSSCRPLCQSGFLPNVARLACVDGAFVPPSFQCVVKCLAPVGILHGGRCQEGSAVASGAQCTTRCDPGFKPEIPSLRCEGGLFVPEDFVCKRVCQGIVGVAGVYRDAKAFEESGSVVGAQACEEGSEILHESRCTAMCADGFVPSLEALDCIDGAFVPAQFQCDRGRNCDSPRQIAGASIPACSEGFSIDHNTTCTPSCNAGFVPSLNELSCWNGVLLPQEFVCNSGCTMAAVPDSRPNPCLGGELILPGELCVASCKTGFTPSVSELRCSNTGTGEFSPRSFACGKDCASPDIPNVGTPACVGGEPIRNGDTCKLNCLQGFAPDGQLSCVGGTLVPEKGKTARCLPGCTAPKSSDVKYALNPTCNEGEYIQHGGACSTLCASPHKPFTKSLECNDGRLIPETFNCIRDGSLVLAPGSRFHDGTPSATHVAAIDDGSAVVVVFASQGQLWIVVGRLSGAEWRWGQSVLCYTGLDPSHNFMARVASLGGRRFMVAFYAGPAGTLVRVGVERTAGLVATLGCQSVVHTGAIAELDATALKLPNSANDHHSLAALALIGKDGQGVIRVGRGRSAALTLQWGEQTTFASTGVSRLVLCPLSFNAVAVMFNSIDGSFNGEQAVVRIAKLEGEGKPTVLGPTSIINSAPTQQVATSMLSGRRFAVAFRDKRHGYGVIVIGQVLDDLSVEWGKRFNGGSADQVVLLALTDEGPLVEYSGRSLLWLAVQGRQLSASAQPTIASTSSIGDGAVAAGGASLAGLRAALLFQIKGQIGPMPVATFEWYCVTPLKHDGYDLKACDTSNGPLPAAGCSVSCSPGYEMSAAGAHAVCLESDPYFQLKGCVPRSCSWPVGVANAAPESCAEGNQISYGANCTAQCLPGYTPMPETLTCKLSRLEPTSFKCIATCCEEPFARVLAGGESVCTASKLDLKTCRAPQRVDFANEPSCVQGEYIRSGSVCTASCGFGRVSNIANLTCQNGALTPDTFTCIIKRSTKDDSDSSNDTSEEQSELFLVRTEFRLELLQQKVASFVAGILRNTSSTESSSTASTALLSGLEESLATVAATPRERVGVGILSDSVGVPAADEAGRLLRGMVRRRLYNTTEGNSTSNNSFLFEVAALCLDNEEAELLVSGLDLVFSRGQQGNPGATYLENGLRSAWKPVFSDVELADELDSEGWLEVGLQSPESKIAMEPLRTASVVGLQKKIRTVLENEYATIAATLDFGDEDVGGDTVDDTIEIPFYLRFHPWIEDSAGAAYVYSVRTFGLTAGPIILAVCAVLGLAFVALTPGCLYFCCLVRRRPVLKAGNARENQFRAVYVIPESHRHRWNMGFSFWDWCFAKAEDDDMPHHRHKHKHSGSVKGSFAKAFCVTFCPWLRVPETWHVSGVLHFCPGMLACCCCPWFIPLIGARLRNNMRSVFGIALRPCCDYITWFLCCYCAAVQEALHVDGAARAVELAQEESAAKAEAEAKAKAKRLQEQQEAQAIAASQSRRSSRDTGSSSWTSSSGSSYTDTSSESGSSMSSSSAGGGRGRGSRRGSRQKNKLPAITEAPHQARM